MITIHTKLQKTKIGDLYTCFGTFDGMDYSTMDNTHGGAVSMMHKKLITHNHDPEKCIWSDLKIYKIQDAGRYAVATFLIRTFFLITALSVFIYLIVLIIQSWIIN